MTKKYPWTFDSYRMGECSEVRNVPLDEAQGYQSTYVYMFNYLRDRGWEKKLGRWVSPEAPYRTYGNIHLAYGSQKYKETIARDD